MSDVMELLLPSAPDRKRTEREDARPVGAPATPKPRRYPPFTEYVGEVEEVTATVELLIPQFHQASLVADDGRAFSITFRTSGITLDELREGQRLRCTVTREFPRVVRAVLIA